MISGEERSVRNFWNMQNLIYLKVYIKAHHFFIVITFTLPDVDLIIMIIYLSIIYHPPNYYLFFYHLLYYVCTYVFKSSIYIHILPFIHLQNFSEEEGEWWR
jgi:hypothetical protein